MDLGGRKMITIERKKNESKERTKKKREKKRKGGGEFVCVCKEQDKGGARRVEDKKICVKRFYSFISYTLRIKLENPANKK